MKSPEETERVLQSLFVFQNFDPVGVLITIIVLLNQKYACLWFPTKNNNSYIATTPECFHGNGE